MWPPIVKLMSAFLTETEYTKGCVRVSWGSSIGTIFIYLVSPIIIMLAGWKSVFILCAVVGVAGLIIWLKLCPEIERSSTINENDSIEKRKEKLISPLVIFIILAIIFQGILRDGVTTWMPSYISEIYNLSNEISILTGVLLPIFSMGCFKLTLYLYAKKLKNPLTCSGALSALLLYTLSDANAVLSVLLSAILSACMHGVNLLLICILPPLIAKKGHESVMSGLLNSCAYVGSAISAYIIPLWAENAGWTSTLYTWFLYALAGTLICFLCVPMWKRK